MGKLQSLAGIGRFILDSQPVMEPHVFYRYDIGYYSHVFTILVNPPIQPAISDKELSNGRAGPAMRCRDARRARHHHFIF
jgi:hypothetical protein